MTDAVTVVGSINLDRVAVVERFPLAGETRLASSFASGFGGKGANQAVAAALAGATVRMVGAVGEGAEGEEAIANLVRHGVDAGCVARVAGRPTGTAWITVAGGDNTIVVVAGANGAVSLHDMPPQPGVVLCQLEIPMDVVEAASRAGARFFALNAAPAQPLSDALLARCDLIIVNEHELAELTGAAISAVSGPAEIAGAARRLLERGTQAVVTTLGARGAQLSTMEGDVTVAAPRVEAVVDTTGAGDAFCGAMVARIAAGDALREAMRWGVAAGSLAVRKLGAQSSYPGAAELATFLKLVPDAVKGQTS